MSKFDFDIIAYEYDSFYDAPIGETIDNLEKNLIGNLIKKLEGNVLVELGCGTGHWTSFFSQNNFFVTGLDISSKMLEVAVKKNIPNSVLLIHDIQELPFLDNSIQNIAAIASLEFVGDQKKVFSEINRVLKPGGSLIVGCLNINSIVGKTKSGNPVFKNANFFSFNSLYEILNELGKPEISGCLYQNEKNEILDDIASQKELLNYGIFLAGLVRKGK